MGRVQYNKEMFALYHETFCRTLHTHKNTHRAICSYPHTFTHSHIVSVLSLVAHQGNNPCHSAESEFDKLNLQSLVH